MVWINVDTVTRKYTIHEHKCYYVERYSEENSEFGKWFSANSLEEAIKTHDLEYSNLTVVIHKRCKGR